MYLWDICRGVNCVLHEKCLRKYHNCTCFLQFFIATCMCVRMHFITVRYTLVQSVPSLTSCCSHGIDGCSGSSTCTCASAHSDCVGGERHKATDGH